MLIFVFLALVTGLRIPKNFIISDLERTVTLTNRYVEVKSKVMKKIHNRSHSKMMELSQSKSFTLLSIMP